MILAFFNGMFVMWLVAFAWRKVFPKLVLWGMRVAEPGWARDQIEWAHRWLTAEARADHYETKLIEIQQDFDKHSGFEITQRNHIQSLVSRALELRP